MLSDIEADPEGNHSEYLEKQASLLSAMLKDLDLPGIISLANTEPDFIEIFGENEDQVNDWVEETKNRIQDLMIKAEKEVSERKAATQTRFKKLSLPSFNGNVLNYQDFKRRWKLEVVPEKRPPALELAALRESIPALAKAKMIAVTTMAEAWKLLDLIMVTSRKSELNLRRRSRPSKSKLLPVLLKSWSCSTKYNLFLPRSRLREAQRYWRTRSMCLSLEIIFLEIPCGSGWNLRNLAGLSSINSSNTLQQSLGELSHTSP